MPLSIAGNNRKPHQGGKGAVPRLDYAGFPAGAEEGVPVNSRRHSPERKARYLILPSLLIVAAGVVILPWLVGTRRNLQNEYWEGQLLMAIVGLSVTLCGIPLLGVRLFRRVPVVAPLGWGITACGYLMMVFYMVQSHIDNGPKFFFLVGGGLCLRWAIMGLALDGKRANEEEKSCVAPTGL